MRGILAAACEAFMVSFYSKSHNAPLVKVNLLLFSWILIQQSLLLHCQTVTVFIKRDTIKPILKVPQMLFETLHLQTSREN